MSQTIILGSIRSDGAGAVVVDTNTGAFVDPPLHNGDGDDTWTLDPQFQIAPVDTVDVQIEGLTAGSSSIERLTTSTFRVRFLDTGGVALLAPYSLRILHTLVG